MAEKIIFAYDRIGDVLDISVGKPQSALSKEIADDFFVRLDNAGKIVGFMLLNFEKRFKTKPEQSVPLHAEFSLSGESIAA